jgi:hypothetical protein
LPAVREQGNRLQLFKDLRSFFKDLAAIGADQKLDATQRRVIDMKHLKEALDKPAENTPYGIFYSAVKRMEKELLNKEDTVFNKQAEQLNKITVSDAYTRFRKTNLISHTSSLFANLVRQNVSCGRCQTEGP